MKKEAKELKDSYVIQAKQQYKWSILEWNISAYIRIFFKDKRVRDWDNWHKISMDSLSWIIYKDDAQLKLVTVDIIYWYDKENPRIELIFDKL